MGFNTPPNTALQCGPGWGKSTLNPTTSVTIPGVTKRSPAPRIKRGIDKLSGWRNPVVEVFLHLPQRPPAFTACQIRPNDTRANNQQDRQADSEGTADLEEQIQLRKWDNGEY